MCHCVSLCVIVCHCVTVCVMGLVGVGVCGEIVDFSSCCGSDDEGHEMENSVIILM